MDTSHMQAAAVCYNWLWIICVVRTKIDTADKVAIRPKNPVLRARPAAFSHLLFFFFKFIFGLVVVLL